MPYSSSNSSFQTCTCFPLECQILKWSMRGCETLNMKTLRILPSRYRWWYLSGDWCRSSHPCRQINDMAASTNHAQAAGEVRWGWVWDKQRKCLRWSEEAGGWSCGWGLYRRPVTGRNLEQGLSHMEGPSWWGRKDLHPKYMEVESCFAVCVCVCGCETFWSCTKYDPSKDVAEGSEWDLSLPLSFAGLTDGTCSMASPRARKIKYAHWNKAGGFSGSWLWNNPQWRRLRQAEEPRKKLLNQLMVSV